MIFIRYDTPYFHNVEVSVKFMLNQDRLTIAPLALNLDFTVVLHQLIKCKTEKSIVTLEGCPLF